MSDQNSVPTERNLPGSDVKTWTILIVDDEVDNRTIAETVLSFSGAKVHTAVHGADGVELLEKITPSFILLDLSMPVMDGWEMLKHIRDNPKTQHIPVIALTAHAMAGDREKALEAGFEGYIAKPFRLGTFMSEINGCFQAIAEHMKLQAAQ
jgi:two-component system, cell cycle response regulator DivK